MKKAMSRLIRNNELRKVVKTMGLLSSYISLTLCGRIWYSTFLGQRILTFDRKLIESQFLFFNILLIDILYAMSGK